MIGYAPALAPLPTLPRRAYIPLGMVIGALVLALSLTAVAQEILARVMLFYAGAAVAYGLMPYVRRGDIPLVAAWVVLLSELAPCLSGAMISPEHVLADSLGVLMAAGPIYLARLRQVMQGDVRPGGRRASETASKTMATAPV